MMTLREAIEYLQYGDWYNHVQEGISQAEETKLGDAIGEICDTLRSVIKVLEMEMEAEP